MAVDNGDRAIEGQTQGLRDEMGGAGSRCFAWQEAHCFVNAATSELAWRRAVSFDSKTLTRLLVV